MRRYWTLAALFFLIPSLGPLAPAPAAQNDPGYANQWGMQRIGAESAWQVGRGAGTVIAIVDTGVHLTHEDLAGKFVNGWDFIDDNNSPQDRDGHGTHVAGIAAATAFNGKGVHGAASDAGIMSIRVLNEFGLNVKVSTELLASVAQAVRWAVDHGADVVNLSVGSVTGQGPGPSLESAIRYAWSKAVIVVVAAGNDEGEPSGYTDQPAIVVAASDVDDQIAFYSNIVGGAIWGITAPGGTASSPISGPQDIYSTFYARLNPEATNRYAYLAGTSMAAPHVSGAAAVLRGLGLSPQQTVDRLLSTAKDLGPSGYDSTYGAGFLDLGRAVPLSSPSGGGGGGQSPFGGGSTGPRGTSSPGGAGGGTTTEESAGEGGGSQETGGGTDAPDGVEGFSPDAPEEQDGAFVKILLAIAAAFVVITAAGLAWTRLRPTKTSS